MNQVDLNIEELKKDVKNEAINLLGDKLLKVVLYGSYARGNFDNESDIDFALIADISENLIHTYNNQVGEITSKLSIEYGILVSLIIISAENLIKYQNVLPFYSNLDKEGKTIYG